MTPGERLADLRDRSGLTTRELADLAGVSRGYVSHVERDRFQPGKKAFGIARVLGCSFEWIVFGDGDPPTNRQIAQAVRAAREEAA